jgi:hypothetical protein
MCRSRSAGRPARLHRACPALGSGQAARCSNWPWACLSSLVFSSATNWPSVSTLPSCATRPLGLSAVFHRLQDRRAAGYSRYSDPEGRHIGATLLQFVGSERRLVRGRVTGFGGGRISALVRGILTLASTLDERPCQRHDIPAGGARLSSGSVRPRGVGGDVRS